MTMPGIGPRELLMMGLSIVIVAACPAAMGEPHQVFDCTPNRTDPLTEMGILGDAWHLDKVPVPAGGAALAVAGITAGAGGACNLARFYDGTFVWEYTLRKPAPDPEYGGQEFLVNEMVTVSINRGGASCEGSRIESSKTWGKGHFLDSDGVNKGVIKGKGVAIVQLESMGTAGGGYRIAVACPEASGIRSWRDYHDPSQDGSESYQGKPVDPQKGPDHETDSATAADYKTLEGAQSIEAPEADPANDVSGTLTLRWKLTQRASPYVTVP